MAVVLRHRQTKFSHRGPAVAQEALPKSAVAPGLGNQTRTVFGQPMLLDHLCLLGNEIRRLEAARIQRRLDGRGSLL
jgi:hypothetical protein